MLKLASPFLLDPVTEGGLGLSTKEVGIAYGTVGLIALTLGGLCGGWVISRVGLKRALWPLVAAMHVPNVAFLLLAMTHPTSLAVISAALAVEQFGYGLGFTAYLMNMIHVADGEKKTAHYAICTGFMALGMMIPGMWSGWLQDQIGHFALLHLGAGGHAAQRGDGGPHEHPRRLRQEGGRHAMKRRDLLGLATAPLLAACTTPPPSEPAPVVEAAPTPQPSASAPTPAGPPPREWRAAWVATVANIDWPSKRGLSAEAQQAEIRSLCDTAVRVGLNALILQVRPSADALYESALEPWSEFLTGTQGQHPGYDPLAVWLAEARLRGLELHASLNPYRARSSTAKSAPAALHVSRSQPDWVKRYGDQLWIDPGEAFALEHDDEPPRQLHAPRDRQRRDGVRRRHDRAEHERHGPRKHQQPVHRCRGRGGGEQHAADREQRDRPEVELELAPAHRDRGRVDERRQHDEQHELGREVDLGQARYQREDYARDHEQDRGRDLQRPGREARPRRPPRAVRRRVESSGPWVRALAPEPIEDRS